MNVIVDLYGDADGVAPADTKTAGESDLVLQSVIVDRFVHQLNDAIRTLDMASTSDAYLNNHLMTIPFCLVWSLCEFRKARYLKTVCFRILYLCHYLVFEEFFYVCGGNGIEIIVKGNAYALLAFAHAESAAEGNLVSDIVFVDHTLELFYYLTGTFDVAGAADAHC
jgi:hypothetical protein